MSSPSSSTPTRRGPIAWALASQLGLVAIGLVLLDQPGARGVMAAALIALGLMGVVLVLVLRRLTPEATLPTGTHAVLLEDAGPQQILATKNLRRSTGFDLRTAMERIEAAGSGAPLVTGVSQKKATEIAEALREAGATAVVTEAPRD